MKNINSISSITSYPETSPKYSLNEEGFLKQLNEAIRAANQMESRKEKPLNVKSTQDQFQISINQMNATAPTKTYNSTVSLNAYKAQKAAVRSKISAEL